MPPKKTTASLVGIRGEREIYGTIPTSWSVGRHDQDYGIDFDLEIWTEDKEPEFFARDVAVQVKSKASMDEYDFSDYYKYSSPILPDISKPPKARLKKSTLEYLSNSNAFLFHFVHEFDERKLPYFQEFFDLFEPDARQLMMIKFGAMGNSRKPFLSVTPLGPIFDLVKDFDKQTISIPIIPQSYHSLPAVQWNTEFDHPEKVWERDPYSLIEEIDFSKVLFLNSWKECVTLGIKNAKYNELISVSYLGHFRSDASDEFAKALRSANGVWYKVEALASTYVSARDPSGFHWLDEQIAEDSAFLNFLVMRCCRKHKVRMSDAFLKYCVSGFPHKPVTLSNDPYDAQRGNSFLSRFFDEAVYYLYELLKYDFDSAKLLVSSIFSASDETKHSLGYLFGSIERHRDLEKELMLLLFDAMGIHPLPTKMKRKQLRLELVRALDSAGIKWYLLERRSR